jgi:hypothetical protein
MQQNWKIESRQYKTKANVGQSGNDLGFGIWDFGFSDFGFRIFEEEVFETFSTRNPMGFAQKSQNL